MGAAGGPDWVLVTVMSSCLGGLFLVSISVISCLLVSARRRHPSPPPSSSGHTKVGSDILLSRFILQDLPIFDCHNLPNFAHCEAQARVRQGSGKDGKDGKDGQGWQGWQRWARMGKDGP